MSLATIHLVPHTHWDREWYLPFQTFRLRLVELLDGLIEQLEAEPTYAFTLDGQLATIDDYLAVRPEAESRLRRLVEEGRLAIGPWKILMDEFLVSGETIVRNLEAGCRRGEKLGGVMSVGYLPDMFGHVAQMPQILRRAGIEHAVVFRGVPKAIDRNAFRWSAPDGSVVRAEYLVGGYGNAAQLLELPDRVDAKLAEFCARVAPFYDDGDLLAMLGEDHAVPDRDTVRRIEQLDGELYRVRIGTLADYVLGPAADPSRHWEGEMRSGARANLLMGVNSTRVAIKAAAARAERGLARIAEPLQALHGEAWPGRLLALAWDRVIANSAHDSICGCSIDPVADQVLVRFAEAEQIATGLADQVTSRLAGQTGRGDIVVVNPSLTDRDDLVELDVPVPSSWDAVAVRLDAGRLLATQELERTESLLLDTTLPAEEVLGLFDRMHGRRLFGRPLNGFHIDPAVPRITYEVDTTPDPEHLDVTEVREAVGAALATVDGDEWQVCIANRPRRRLLASVPVPALGATALRVVKDGGTTEPAGPHARRVEVGDRTLDNGLVRVVVADDGTLGVQAGEMVLTGAGRLVDGGDAGDSYNYAPPGSDLVVDTPLGVEITPTLQGPLAGSLRIDRAYRWPARLQGEARSARMEQVTVSTVVELRTGEPFVRVELAFDNRCADHRLRWHLPLPAPVDGSSAEGQFAVVQRGLEAEGGHGEVPLPTFPALGFVAVDGVAVLLDHLTEYEVVDQGRALALTVLRAIGRISRNDHPYREEPAGPETPTPGAQCQGPHRLRFALYPHEGSWHQAGVLDQMERYHLPFRAAVGTAADREARPDVRGLALEGHNVMLTALRRRDDWLEARLVCEQPQPARCRLIGGITRARDADILGRPGPSLPTADGAVELDLDPWEIRTVQLQRTV